MARQRSRGRLLAVLLSTLLGLGLAELLVRGLGLAPLFQASASTALNLYHEDPNGPVRMTPGWRGHVSGLWTTINARGFRDELYAPRPAPGVTRVAVFGDSYSMGDGVPLEWSYPKQLERLLREAGLECEVMNCAVSATNTWNQLPIVREVLAEYAPDFVILGYNLNDFDNPTRTRFEELEAAGHELRIAHDGRVTLADSAPPWHQRIRLALFERSHLYRTLLGPRSNSRGASEARLEALRRWIEAGDHLHSFEALDRMREACAAAEVPFLVALLPDTLRLPDGCTDLASYPFAEEHRMVLWHLAEGGIEGLDLTPRFAGRGLEQLTLDPRDRHFNRAGHALVAEGLAELLLRRL